MFHSVTVLIRAHSSRLSSPRTRSQLSRARAPRVGLDFGWKFRQEPLTAQFWARGDTRMRRRTNDGNRIWSVKPLITFLNRGFNAHLSLIFHRNTYLCRYIFCSSTLWASTDTYSESHLIRDESSTPWWFTGRGSSCHESRCTQHWHPSQTITTWRAYLWPSVRLSIFVSN